MLHPGHRVCDLNGEKRCIKADKWLNEVSTRVSMHCLKITYKYFFYLIYYHAHLPNECCYIKQCIPP